MKIEPRPVQQPCPIWIASNPTGLTWKGGASASDAAVERGFRRVARYADGWMTNKVTPAQFASSGRASARWRARRAATRRASAARSTTTSTSTRTGAALEESKAFLDAYYTARVLSRLRGGVDGGGRPAQCAASCAPYFGAGLGHMALRLTSWDQRAQLNRFLAEVAPALGDR